MPVSKTTRPVTHTEEVEVKIQSIMGVYEWLLDEIGIESRMLPSSIRDKNPNTNFFEVEECFFNGFFMTISPLYSSHINVFL
jgi:hypothetical protein